MQANQIGINLKAKVREAKELLARYQKELDSDAEDFALKLRFNSFRRHVQDLENQLVAHEAFESGWKFLSQAKIEEAKKEFRHSVELMPSYLGFLNNQLTNNASEDNLELIIIFMKFLLELNPNYEVVRKNLISAYIRYAISNARGGNFLYAINLLHIASSFVNSEETAKTIFWNLGTAYTQAGKKSLQKGNLEESAIHLTTAFSYVRNEATAYNAKLSLAQLALNYLNKHEFDKAIQTFKHIEIIFGLEPALSNDLAVALACIGRTKEGIAILENLEQDKSNLPEDIFNCAKNNLNTMKKQHNASLKSGLRLSPRILSKGNEKDSLMSMPTYLAETSLIFQHANV
jgi:tetratricopeptide (TPR) repeat protein